MNTLDEALAHVKNLTAEQKAELDKLLTGKGAPMWVPQPGPQSMAYDSRADITFYGGAAGGGKTDLLLGFLILVELLHRVARIDDGDDTVEQIVGRNLFIHKKCLRDRTRVSQAGGFDYHPVKLQLAGAPFLR